MKRAATFVLRNWPLKLGTIVLASVLYSGLVLSQNVRTFSNPVPIEALRQPPSVALLTELPPITQIRYRAPLDVGLLSPESFSATVDLSRVAPAAADEEGVEVPVNVVAIDRRIVVVDYTPRTVQVRLDPVETRTMVVTPVLGAVPDGLSLGPPQISPPMVDVRGASSRVAAIQRVIARVSIDASGINVDRQVDLVAVDEQGNQVPNVVIEPARVHVQIAVARELASRTLPVVAELTGELPAGYRIGSLTVRPLAVTVSGEESALTGMDGAHTEPIDLAGRTADFEMVVGLDLPAQVATTGSGQVTVAVTVVADAGTRSFQVGVALAGARSDRLYLLGTPSVDIVLGGTLAELEAVDPAELQASLWVGPLGTGAHTVTVEFRPPGGLRVLSITPPSISVTIEQPQPSPTPTPEPGARLGQPAPAVAL